MKELIQRIKVFVKTNQFKIFLKWVSYGCLIFIGLVLILAIALRIYFDSHKAEIVTEINKTINDNVLGHVSIGDIDYKFLISFPSFTIVLKNVEARDRLYAIHKRSVFTAGKVEVRLNILRLLTKNIDITKVLLVDTKIDLFKDKNGVSNSDILKPKSQKKKSKNAIDLKIHEIDFKNVIFISQNVARNKLFHFEVAKLKSKIDYSGEDWEAKMYIDVLAKSMAFNTVKGSFIKGKRVNGKLALAYSKDDNTIEVLTNDLQIESDYFDIKANFDIADKDHPIMNINIQTKILWGNAIRLLNAHLFKILHRFNLSQPIKANCTLKGDLNAEGDPEIVVIAEIKDNDLTVPDGNINNCNFTGKFTNNFKKGLGYNDPNSAIILADFSGSYKEIPFVIPTTMIRNLEKPVASGNLESHFNVVKMKNILGDDPFKFYRGKANVDLKFEVDIVDLRVHKPHFTGKVDIQNAKLHFKSKNLVFETNILLDFTEQALLIRNIKYQSGDNIVYLDGKIENFLNLYYDDPEKMVAVLNLNSPYMDANKFFTVLTYKNRNGKTNNGKSTRNDIKTKAIVQKCKVDLNLTIDKMKYNHLTAKNAKINIIVNNRHFLVKKGWIETCGGSIKFESELIPDSERFNVASKVNIATVDIPTFLRSFKNFGVKSFKANTIQGKLSATVNVKGQVTPEGDLIEDSMKGNLQYDIQNGALLNFEPIVKVGKFAFPNRDVKHIVFHDLSGKMNLKGSKININYCKVSSNVLNFDVEGVYSFKKGTCLGLTIPLRNPKDDMAIKNKKEREAQRNKGIVLNLLVVDGQDGEMKIKLGKYKKS